MTGRWLTLTSAASRIHEATGRHVSIEDVLLLGEKDRLKVRLEHQHHGVLEESVTTYLAWLAAKTPVGEGPALPADIEDEYRRGQGT